MEHLPGVARRFGDEPGRDAAERTALGNVSLDIPAPGRQIPEQQFLVGHLHLAATGERPVLRRESLVLHPGAAGLGDVKSGVSTRAAEPRRKVARELVAPDEPPVEGPKAPDALHGRSVPNPRGCRSAERDATARLPAARSRLARAVVGGATRCPFEPAVPNLIASLAGGGSR